MTSSKRYAPRGKVTFYLPTNTPPQIIDFLNKSRNSGVLSHEILEALDMHVNGGHSPKGKEGAPLQKTGQPSESAPSMNQDDKNIDAMERIRAQSKRIIADPSNIISTKE
jgi:hypothetical protein